MCAGRTRRNETYQSLHSAHSIIGPSSSSEGFLHTQYSSSFLALAFPLPLAFVVAVVPLLVRDFFVAVSMPLALAGLTSSPLATASASAFCLAFAAANIFAVSSDSIAR